MTAHLLALSLLGSIALSSISAAQPAAIPDTGLKGYLSLPSREPVTHAEINTTRGGETGPSMIMNNSQGFYSLWLDVGEYAVVVQSNGMVAGPVSVHVPAHSWVTQNFTLTQLRTVSGVRGALLKESGDPISPARIDVSQGAVRVSSADVKDARGRFSLELPPGVYLLQASAPGYEASTLSLTITRGAWTPLNVTLHAASGTLSTGAPGNRSVPLPLASALAAIAGLAWALRRR